MNVGSSHSAGSSELSSAPHNGAGIYSHLDKSKSEIRLLTFSNPQTQPNDTPRLYASINTFSFDSDNLPLYHALSYEWNPPNSPSTTTALIIDGKEKQVSLNLYFALLYLRRSTYWNGPFWVDALCINQEDTAERNHQVQLMRRIYGEALGVCVWLGIDWTLTAEKWSASLLREIEPRASEAMRAYGSSSHLRDDENYKTHWEAIDFLFCQSYWNRSWIIQELVAAKVILLLTNEDLYTFNPLFLDGFMLSLRTPLADRSLYDRSTNWAAIRSSTENVDEKALRHRMNAHLAVEAISRTKETVSRKIPDYHNDLLSLLARFCGQLATDPRDKVYSLLGIEEPNSDNSIRVDYTLKWTEVLRDAAIYVIRDRNDLEVLVYGGSGVTGLPSWVPDWLGQEHQGTMRFPHDKYCLKKRCCSPHTAHTPLREDRAGRWLPTISADGSLLTISAGLFNIQACSKVDSPGVDMEAWRTWAPLGELGDIMFSTWRANLVILDDSDPEFPAKVVLENSVPPKTLEYFDFYPGASEILSQNDFIRYIASCGRHSLTEQQRELLQRALDAQSPFLTKVPPSVGSAIFRSNIFKHHDAEFFAKRILDRQASVYIPGMCFWSPERGTLGPNHVLASIPLCRFPIILSKPDGSGKGYKVITSARVANLENCQIEQDDGTTFELPVQEIDLV